ncbi:MAG: AAA domain-containing protein [Candidatus Auribacterota bacterium]|jgi:very-short-patch-repair endonuclease|nr:AAA domain-containing protein [Candidatus Auribacterota bacterium]
MQLIDEQEQILDILREANIPLTTKDITFRMKSSKYPSFIIFQILRKLHIDRKVKYTSMRWTLSVEEPDIFQDRKRPSLKIHSWKPSKSCILQRTSDHIDDKVVDLGWNRFRILLDYYMDCVRNDGCGEYSAYVNKSGKTFFCFSDVGPWYPRYSRKWQKNLPFGIEKYSDFRKQIIGSGESALVAVGWPIQIYKTTDGEFFLKPIFTYRVSPEFSPSGLNLIAENPYPEVNPDWIRYNFQKASAQRDFLYSCGFFANDVSNEDNEEWVPDLQHLGNVVTSLLSSNIKEPLIPQCIASELLSKNIEPGIYNRAIVIQGTRPSYMSTLLKELAKIKNCSDQDLEKTALRWIFKQETSDFSRNHLSYRWNDNIYDAMPFNSEQREAIQSMLDENISLVTGPPGTGKSQTIVGAMLNMRLKSKSVLFASRNHKAIDAVYDRSSIEDEQLIVRANSKDSDQSFSFGDAATELLLQPLDMDIYQKWDTARQNMNDLLSERGKLCRISRTIHIITLASVDVQDKLDDFLHGEFSGLLEKIQKISWKKYPLKSWYKYKRNQSKFFVALKARLRIKRFFRYSRILKEYLFYKKQKADFISIVSQFYVLKRKEEKLSLKLKKILNENPKIAEQIKSLSDVISKDTTKLLQLDLHMRKGLPKEIDRAKFASIANSSSLLSSILGKEENEIRNAVRKEIPILLNHYPLWAVTSLSVGSKIPFEPGIFDLAIIDEASQCDIASSIPILFRSRRAAVVGDPNQLKFVTKLVGTKDALLRHRHGLEQQHNEHRFAYPNTSIYDLFSYTQNVVPHLLCETFRSITEIAEYSNQYFYKGNLRVMTRLKDFSIPNYYESKKGIIWTPIEGNIKQAGLSGCYCSEEIDEVVKLIEQILQENIFSGTVGVVTPFAEQKKRLYDVICMKTNHYDRERISLIVDTIHGFQGDEKDVIIFSLCGGNNMPQGSKHFLYKNPHLFNVAVSRARGILHIIGNKNWAKSSGIKHIEGLTCDFCHKRTNNHKTEWYPHESPWEKKFFDALQFNKIPVEPQYHILGRRLDLAIIKGTKKIDIEVDGDIYHRNYDGTRKVDDHWRDIQLIGAGWIVKRFWVYQLKENIDKCVAEILEVING